MTRAISKVVIVGGGTAGWITAALLVKALGRSVRIELVESEEIGTVGVGEATIPPIQTLNRALGLDEADFLRATQGTIKLGIEFHDWGGKGEAYMHAFGAIGPEFPFGGFHHFWARGRQEGRADSLWDYSLNYQAARQNRFAPLERIAGADLPGLVYAYHFDAGLYAAYLRRYSEGQGVVRTEGRIDAVEQDAVSGDVIAIRLRTGHTVAGDLFIDCSGFRGLLIEQSLNTGFEDWGHWLPCDRAVAVGCAPVDPVVPYTRSTALEAGWQWRIPLQHRTGNGIVYCSRYLGDDEAKRLLLSRLDGAALSEPRLLSFRAGRRLRQWNRNCVAVGLSSGFLEPLESTSIHLIQSAVVRLLKLFPHRGIRQEEVDEYNRQSRVEFEHIRDFIILHYYQTTRDDSPFWRQCRAMQAPQSLLRRMALFGATGKIFREQDELFSELAWLQVMVGQGLEPADYHPLADNISREQLDDMLGSVRTLVTRAAAAQPLHAEFLAARTRAKDA